MKRILPSEETLLDGGALLIMDILVELEDSSLANVEIQKVPYLFPGERMSCYSSDLVLRQYSRVKGEKGKAFTYSDMKKVYTIVLFETSTMEFHREGLGYIHRGKITFDTGLELELLQEYCLIALDVFRKILYPKDRSEQTGWLSLLAVEDVSAAEALKQDYPWLEEIYRDMAEYMRKPEEVLNMFSEALKILDQNTVQYMIDLQQKELEQQRKELEQQRKELEQQQKELEEKERKLEEKDRELLQKDELLMEQNEKNQRLREENARLQKQLAEG